MLILHISLFVPRAFDPSELPANRSITGVLCTCQLSPLFKSISFHAELKLLTFGRTIKKVDKSNIAGLQPTTHTSRWLNWY